MSKQEIWLPITGTFGAYEVSDRGRVRSRCRHVEGKTIHGRPVYRLRAGRVLRPGVDRRGYRRVGLYVDGNKQCEMKLVHRLVAAAFVGNPEGHRYVLHLDGDPANNNADNLRWGSGTENNEMVISHGRRKVSMAQVRNIRASRESNCAWARRLGVSDVFISKIRSRKLYAHII